MLPFDAGDIEDLRYEADPRAVENQLRRLRQIPASLRGYYPTPDDPDIRHHWGVWYRKVPTTSGLIRASRIAQRQLIRALIAAVRVLRRNRPPGAAHHRVVALIDVPDFHGSEISVFFDDDYFREFLDRTSHYQTWTPLPPERSLCAEWQIPSDLAELGFAQVLHDEGVRTESEIWLLGDVTNISEKR